MTAVSGRECVRYGIKLLGLIFFITFTSGVVAGTGFVIAGGGAGTIGSIVGWLVFSAGGLLALSGLAGLWYKVIADAVERAGAV